MAIFVELHPKIYLFSTDERIQLRRWKPDEKMAIVLEALWGQKSVAEICREHQISQSLF